MAIVKKTITSVLPAMLLVAQGSVAGEVPVGVVVGKPLSAVLGIELPVAVGGALPVGLGGAALVTGIALIIGVQLIKRRQK